jgi:uncharacterized protein (TIGR02271 family)
VTGRSDSRSGEGRRGLSAGRAVAVGAVLGTAAQVAARLLRQRSGEYGRATRQRSGELDRATRAAPKPKPHMGSGDAMTRSEEELKVRTVRRRRGRVRLRKYVVTEEVQRTIPLRREEIRVEEVPIPSDDARRATEDADVSSEDEIVLYKEIPVIEKRVVPAERVRIVKDVRADEAQISEKLRKERIDVETDAER